MPFHRLDTVFYSILCSPPTHPLIPLPFTLPYLNTIPTTHARLSKQSEFQTVTAGKFKRTLTPTKKFSKEDFDKTKEDVEDILALFRDFVGQNRPVLDMDKVATGETWFGKDALELGLCDEIKTVDDVLTEYVDGGYTALEISYEEPQPELSKLFAQASVTGKKNGGSSIGNEGILKGAFRWLVRTVVEEVTDGLKSPDTKGSPLQERYMMMDDKFDKYRY